MSLGSISSVCDLNVFAVKVLELDPAKDSWMILACDGIWNSMSSEEVVEFVNKKINDVPDDKLSTLCEEVKCNASTRCQGRMEGDIGL